MRRQSAFAAVVLFLGCCLAHSAFAGAWGFIDLAAFEADPKAEIQRYLVVYGGTIGVTDTSQVWSASTMDMSEETRSIRVLQQFRGIPLAGGGGLQLTVDKASGNILSVRNGWRVFDPSTSVEPSITADSAVAAAIDTFQARLIQAYADGLWFYTTPSHSIAPKLAWQVFISGDGVMLDNPDYPGQPISCRLGYGYFVDAHTGAILDKYSLIDSFVGTCLEMYPTAVREPPAPQRTPTLQVVPNPFNPTVTIRYRVDAPGVVRLAMYNVAGQRVRELVNHTHQLGAYTVAWDGLDGSGRAASSGVYIVRLTTPTNSTTRRVTLLR